MTMAERIRVNTRYTRSTNVERDRGQLSIVEAYLPTSRALHLLRDVAGSLDEEHRPRAWNLIGPYGSGKSSFALFLHELLEGSAPEAACNAKATEILATSDSNLAKSFQRQEPWCRVVLTGGNEPIAPKLLAALDDAATRFWDGRPGRKPTVLRDIKAALQQPTTTDSQILALVDALQGALERVHAGGLVIVIDELGKFLEFAARTGGPGEGIFLLQELAERAFRGREANLLLFVLLHQGFDLYAQGLSETRKNEWAKVQGRFESVSFIETVEQTLRIVGAAFSNDLKPGQRRAVKARAAAAADALRDAGALPNGLAHTDAARLFAACFPLHPIALLALPVLCQRFAQNERTLFSYLGSREPHGFQDALLALADGEFVQPDLVYDYFVHNQPAVLADPLTHRRWAEVVTAVERAERVASARDAEGARDVLRLAKTIGLLNLVSGNEGLRATPTVLRELFTPESRQRFDSALAHLLDSSVVQFRSFSGEYRVWQGTDFNIDEQTEVERDKLGHFDLATALSERTEVPQIVARRHSFDTGALRHFDIAFVDARSRPLAPASDGNPRVIFFVAEGADDASAFHDRRVTGGENDVWVLNDGGATLRAAIRDVLSLESVQRGAQALASDPIATREIRERLLAARRTEHAAIHALVDEPGASEWYWRDKRLAVLDRRTLQRALSDIMDRVYGQSPQIQNELINRSRLSSQAAAARNKLFEHMLEQQGTSGLGIEKHPPERSIYRSIFELGGTHVRAGNLFEFVAPRDDDALKLGPVWKRLDQTFLESETNGPVSTKDLMDDLARPPFGLKPGVFPVIFLHYYIVHRYEIAFYEDGAYAPDLGVEHLERLVRHPHAFTFQRFRIEGVRASLFEEYSRALFGEVRDAIDVLGIARPLSHFVLGLDEYARKTRRLDETTLHVREAFLLSKSPEKLLFEELPRACGFDDTTAISGLSGALQAALRELKNAHATLLDEMRVTICSLFGLTDDTPLDQVRTTLAGRSYGLDSYTVDTKGLKGFLRRLADDRPPLTDWFNRVLLFLGHKPADKWSDQDRDTAEYRLAEFSRRFLDLEKLRLHHDSARTSTANIDVILLKTLSKDAGEQDEVVTLGPATLAGIAEAREKVRAILDQINDNELALALIAQIAEDTLTKYRKRQPELWRGHALV